MAFTLSQIDEKTRIPCNFWKVNNVVQHVEANATDFDLCLYFNQDAFNAGASPFSTINFFGEPGQLEEADCQAIVLGRTEFSGAVVI